MSNLFDKSSENVLDILNSDVRFSDELDGGFFDDADSNFLGIAIGKKAKARKKAKRDDRQAARKYKSETERIRALQGQEGPSVVKDIANGLASVAGSIFGGGTAIQPEQPYQEQQPAYSQQQPSPAQNNTIIYMVIGVIVIGAAIYLFKK